MQRLVVAVAILFARAASADPCGRAVEIEVDADGVWMATAADQSCFAPSKDARAWLASELATFVSSTCPLAATLRIGAGSSLQLAIEAMARVDQLGGTATLSASDATRRFGTRPPARRPPPLHCKPPHDAAPQPSHDPRVQETSAIANAPRIAISKHEIFFAGRELVKLDAVVARNAFRIDELVGALPKPDASKGVVIVEADVSSDARVISLVVMSAKAAGYTDVVFAVQ